jgi:hypothetical protein
LEHPPKPKQRYCAACMALAKKKHRLKVRDDLRKLRRLEALIEGKDDGKAGI